MSKTWLLIIVAALACNINLSAFALDTSNIELQFEKKTGKVIGIVNKEASRENSPVRIQARSYQDPKEKELNRIMASDAFLTKMGKLFGIADVTSELYPRLVKEDNLGITQVRYEQQVNGVPVLDSGLISYLNSNGEVLSVKGSFQESAVNVDTKYKIKGKRALNIARKNLERERGWNKIRRVLKRENRRTCRKNKRTSRAVTRCVNKAVKRFTAANGFYEAEPIKLYIRNGELVWKVNLINIQDNGQTYFVDAKSGEIVEKESHLQHATVRQVFDCGDEYGDETCWMDRLTFSFGTEFYYGRSEGNPPSGPNPNPAPINGSTDVDYFYEIGIPDINSFYMEKFGRDGVNSLGGTVVPAQDGINNISKFFANANWTSYLSNACANNPEWAAAGLGHVMSCAGSRTFDLIAHEFSHIVARNMGLNADYSQISLGKTFETGALNEHIADLFAEGFERWKTGSNDWIFWPEDLGGGRDLKNPAELINDYWQIPYPNRFGSSTLICATTATSSNDNGGIHHNSTVPSHAAYLASEGGQFNGCTIQGIGLEKVEQIWYRALTTYFVPNETFNMAFHSINQACQDFVENPQAFSSFVPPFQISQDDCDQVKTALQAVEMDQAGFCSGLPPEIPECAVEEPEFSGDFNGDEVVDLNDYQILRGRWSYPSETAKVLEAPPEADANGDGVVNMLDYNIWQADFLSDNPGVTPPPPPTLMGDYDFDGEIDYDDFLSWQAFLGQTGLGLLPDGNVDGVIDYGDLEMWAHHHPSGLAGDFNGDSVVDLWDYNQLRKDWGKTEAGLASDVSRDGSVTDDDYDVWLNVYNQTPAPAAPTLPGDCDGSGAVDDNDYLAWKSSFNASGPGLACDFNADGFIDAADYSIWRDNKGSGN